MRKVLSDRQDLPVRKEVLGSRGLPAHKARKERAASQVLPVPRDRQAHRGRQALSVTSKGPEILSRAMMAKYLFRPFARKVQLFFKERPGPNAEQHPD